MTNRDAVASPFFPPEVAIHTVKIACERPDHRGRSLSQWDCAEIVRQLVAEGVVSSISVETVRKILASHRLKPWRKQMWLSAKTPRDEAFAEAVRQIASLYTRALEEWERVVCVDEHTSLQPRPRLAPTCATRPDQPTRVEHEYRRCGALNLLGAFDTRTGQVLGEIAPRKRQIEFIALLEQLEAAYPPNVTRISVVLDNVRMHTGKLVQAWLEKHSRFVFVHPPVHCSWMNQIEQWFSILVRKRLRIADFASKEHLAERLRAFMEEWNAHSHGFKWTQKSFQKILDQCEKRLLKIAA